MGSNKNPLKIYHDGRNMTVKEWSEELGLCEKAIILRVKKGIPLNYCFKAGGKRITEGVFAYKKLKPSKNIKVKIYVAFSMYLKRLRYREIRDSYVRLRLDEAA